MTALIEARDLVLSFGETPALRGADLSVAAGEVLAIMGPSGSGKSTLLHCLAGILRPEAGEVVFDGRRVDTLEETARSLLRRRDFGIVLQFGQLLPELTAVQNVALPLRVLGRREETYRDEVIELLNWVGLGDRMWALPPVLSGGEKQRAAIARAVIARPQLLLADEPTGNVDPSLAQRLLRLFIELNKSGTSVVIATHDIALMDQYDARRLVLHDGRLHIYD